MERVKNLDRYPKAILLILSAMLVIFTAAYVIVSSRVGFEYRGTILRPTVEDGNTVYAGRIHGEDIRITVTPNKSVSFQYEDKTYGPYTAKKDTTAIPKDSEMAEYMTGVEIRQGDDVFFRGGVFTAGRENSDIILYDEDGSFSGLSISVSTGDGFMYDAEGNVIDQRVPTASTILHLMGDPELTSKGEWMAWFCGVFLSVVTALLILFADELFRHNLRFMIRNVEHAEPSDWEIASRYISWTVLPIMALVSYIMGLTT